MYTLLPFIAVIGALLMGYVTYTLSPEVCGSGLDAIIGAFHNRSSVRRRVPVLKIIASAFTIGIGGSVGKEGPAAQIGGGFASYIASRFKLTRRDRELLMLTGAAACLAAVFKSPFGAAFFIIEVLYLRDYEVEAFIPCIVATFISYGLYCSFLGWSTLFNTPVYFFIPSELPFFIILGVICGLAGIVFSALFRTLKNKVFTAIRISFKLKPALGMVFIALCFILFPYAVGTGYGYIQSVINNELPLQILAVFIVMKMFSTSFTVTSGNSGGDFAPSLVIGGLIGGLFAIILQQTLPSLMLQPGILVVCGMGSFIAAIAKTPIASIIIVSEMTASYTVLAPAILASLVAYIISGKWSIYENQMIDRTYSYSHIPEILRDIFSHINVRKIMSASFTRIQGNLTIRGFEELIRDSEEMFFPVVDDNDDLIGVIDKRAGLSVPEELKSNIKIAEICSRKFTTITPDENAKEALHKLIISNIDILPVVDPKYPKKILGTVTHKDIEKIMNL
ncbi:MAG: chloride channel protein [Candidatus Odinarchaeota archaeon]